MYPNTGGWGSQYYRRRQPGEGEQRAPLFERRGSRAPAHAPTAARDPSPVCANTPAAKSSADIRTKLIHLKSKLTESPLPKEFNDVVTRLSCKLCGVTSPEPKYMKPHWKSVKHEDEVRYWLVHWYRDLRADEDLWNNRPKAYEYEEDEAYCFICMKPFTSSEIAQVHYDSKQHEKRILNLLCPMALSKYDEICVFMCEICNVTCPTKQQLEIHKNSPNHAKKLRVLGIDVEIPVSSNIDQPHNEMKYECKICNIKTYTEESLKIHVTGTKHLRKFKKASGEGVIDPAGICGQNIFTYECKICSVISDTHEMLDVHIQSKKHKSSVEKRKDKQDSKKEVDTVKLRPTQSNLLNDKYKCDICNIHANAEGQFRMHMESAKHAKAVARYNALNQRQAGPSKRSMQDSSLHSSSHIPSKQVRSCGVVVKQEVEHNEVTVKKEAPCDRVVVEKEVEHDEEIDSERVISNSTQLLLRRYHHLVLHCIRRGRDEYEAARSCIGCCGQLFLMLMPGEFIWHTLQRNRCIWHKDMNCSSSVVLSDNNDVWRVTATFAGMSATAEGSDMQSTRLAAGELMLNKLQRIYFTVRMPKDVYEKLENFENFDEDDEEEEEQVVEEGILTYESDDEELVEIKVEKEEVLIESKLYMIKKEDQVNKGFEEMVKFYLNDYMANLEDFRDMVFVNFSSEERSAIREISVEFGIDAEYRRRRKSKVVLVSKINTLYKNDPWLFLQVLLQYKNAKFQEWYLQKPGINELPNFASVKFIDE